jgi:hypothetical protein
LFEKPPALIAIQSIFMHVGGVAMPKRKAPVPSKQAPSKLQKKPKTKKTHSPKKRTELTSSAWYGKAAKSLAIRRGSS